MSLREALRTALGKAGIGRTTAEPPSQVVPQAPVPRHDPLPDPSDFPAGRYVFMVDTIPLRYAGRTASILAKARAFRDRAQVTSEILVLGWSAELEEVVGSIHDRGALVDGLRIRSLYEWIDDDTVNDQLPVDRPLDEPGLQRHYDVDDGVHRLFDGPQCVRELVADAHGRLRVRRTLDAEGTCVEVEDFNDDGNERRRATFVAGDTKPRREVYYRNNGARRFVREREVDPTEPRAVTERVTLFNADDQPVEILDSWADYVLRLLDRFAGEDRIFLTVEARVCDPFVLAWERPNVKRLFVLHNPHILPPYDDPLRIRGGFKGLLRARSRVTTVFLTEAQRADAELRFGRTDTWVVIPHAAREVAPTPGLARDPDLVVMIARLSEQKQLDHAVRAFALVIERVPGARLEIYGQGPERDRIQALIDRLGIGGSVRLAGYTTSPDETFQGAALSLLTSQYEALGLTLVESLMNGCPVVSYDIRYGPADVIEDGRTGLLVPAGDVDALAEAIIELLADPPRRAAMGQAGTSVQARFNEDVFLRRWAAVFHRLDAEGWGS